MDVFRREMLACSIALSLFNARAVDSVIFLDHSRLMECVLRMWPATIAFPSMDANRRNKESCIWVRGWPVSVPTVDAFDGPDSTPLPSLSVYA